MTAPIFARRKSSTFRRRLVLIVTGLFLAAAVVTVFLSHGSSVEQIASKAIVTASSTDPLFSARDAVGSGSTEAPGAGWVSNEQGIGAWIELTWPTAESLQQITLVRNPLDQPGVTAGYLTFGDGSHLFVLLSTTSRQTTLVVDPGNVTSMRFTASDVSAGTTNVTISEIKVTALKANAGNIKRVLANLEPPESVTSGSDNGASVVSTPVDGGDSAGGQGFGTEWTSPADADAWVQLNWGNPQELTSVQVSGAVGSARTIRRGTLLFSDGSQIQMGAVTSDPTRATTVSFMPRMTRSVRLTIDDSDGSGDLVLAGIRAYGRGTTPLRHSSASAPISPLVAGDQPVDGCANQEADPTPLRLEIRCPVMGSTVDGDVTFSLVAPAGYTSVHAAIWSADANTPEGVNVEAPLSPAGTGTVSLISNDLPFGPFTVNFQAIGAGLPGSEVNFQLYRPVRAPEQAPASEAAQGRTMTFSDEFRGPISISRSGARTEYAAAKPVWNGEQDFGEAIFADPAFNNNIQIVDSEYLRMDVAPIAPGQVDPQGWGRKHIGALLASARAGGSGFSAQYGYFETRMAVPAAPGTWPAFWMLSNDNLIAKQAVEAEIDAVELYGHNALSTCSSTHQHQSTVDQVGIADCAKRFESGRVAAAWHTYGVAVLPDINIFYIDGVQVASAPQVAGAESPMFFLVDLALGGGWPVDLTGIQDRASLYVDYIRVYV